MKPMDPEAISRVVRDMDPRNSGGIEPLSAHEIFGPTDDECRDCGAPIYPGDCDPDDAVLCAAHRGDLEDWRVER